MNINTSTYFTNFKQNQNSSIKYNTTDNQNNNKFEKSYKVFDDMGGVFSEDKQLEENITNFLDTLSVEEYVTFVVGLSDDFRANNINLDGKIDEASIKKDKYQEFKSLETTEKYYQSKINELKQNDSIYGKDTNSTQNLYNRLIQIVDYTIIQNEKKVQENQYLKLGQLR